MDKKGKSKTKGIKNKVGVYIIFLYDIFRAHIPDAVHGMILDNVLLLMTSAAREILKGT